MSERVSERAKKHTQLNSNSLTCSYISFHFCFARRTQFDERATARKSAVTALVSYLFIAPPASSSDIAVLDQRCADSSIATRKAAAEGLTKLLLASKKNNKTDSELEIAWVRSVLPLVNDAEVSCVSKALDLFFAVVVGPLTSGDEYGGDPTAWRVLSRMNDSSTNHGGAKGGIGSLKTALKRSLENNQSVSIKLLKVLKSTAIESLGLGSSSSSSNEEETQNLWAPEQIFKREGVWCLLEALAGCSSTSAGRGGEGGGSAPGVENGRIFDLNQAVKKSKLEGVFLVQAWDKFREVSERSGGGGGCGRRAYEPLTHILYSTQFVFAASQLSVNDPSELRCERRQLDPRVSSSNLRARFHRAGLRRQEIRSFDEVVVGQL